jgi:TonB family protein
MRGFMLSDKPHGQDDLLGLAQTPPKVRVSPGPAPEFGIAWGAFRQSLASSLLILFGGPIAPKEFRPGFFFRDCWIERRLPRKAVAAAALWHVAFFILPWPDLPAAPRATAFENAQITWSGPIEDLPLMHVAGKTAAPTPRGEPNKPLPPEGADAFHPRQRIFTDPAHPTHPRQTLINSAAPAEAPKFLPNLPNMVQLGPAAQPARPRIFIDPKVLARLHPRVRHRAAAAEAPALDAPNLEPKIGELSLAASANAPARPKMQINASSAPRAGAQTRRGEAEAAPEIGSQLPGIGAGNPSTLIALSATPAAPTPEIVVPNGNLSARVSISPEGMQRGVPGGAASGAPGSTGGAGGAAGSGGGPGTGEGGSGVGVSITGGDPGKLIGISGLGGGKFLPRIVPEHALPGHPGPRADASDSAVKSAPPNFGALPPGAKPEEIFGPKRVYTLYVNMPNLNSVTGSWILNFSEMRDEVTGRPMAAPGELAGPAPLRKVDPKYPPALVSERIEGEVILYAVIRKDGSVDSIQLVRGIDERLDANAMNALAHWKFRPAERQGAPVELEAIVHVPFRAIERQY